MKIEHVINVYFIIMIRFMMNHGVVKKNGKKYRPVLISGDGTCEFFESWELKEKQKLKQKMLF